jgi:hypothetical protein
MYRKLLLVFILSTFAFIGSTVSFATPDASAHTTISAWKCKYLMWYRAANGERYQWMLRCEKYVRTHVYQHRYGFDVGHCYLYRPSVYRRKCVISGVFSKVGQSGNAQRVAYCESRYSTTATNGQYRGMFQMGSSERERFGHGSSALAQSRAALRYYRIAGWRPWECKPY